MPEERPEASGTAELVSDADLITAIRSGDMSAYGELYRRHVAAAQGLARQLVRGPAEVDDVVAETFSKVLDLMRRGGGPQDAFRPYLLTAVRRVAYDRFRGERRNVTTDEIEAFDPGQPFIDPAVAGLERSLIAKAFLSLPERWRAVLWHTEIEGAKPADVAPLLGLTANGVAALAYRAREGLRQAYLQMHLSGVARQECRPVVEKLGAYVRGGLSAREAKAVSAHLDDCADCRAVYAELADVNVALRGIVAPIFLGPAVAAYLAAVSGKGGAVLGWIVARLLWIRHAPKGQQAAVAGGVAAAGVLVAALALALTGHSTPLAAHHHRPRPAAAPLPPSVPAQPAPAKPHPHPHPAQPVVKVPPAPTTPPAPATTPAPSATPPTTPASSPPTSPPPTSPPPTPLQAGIAPVGALLRGLPGLLTFVVTNPGTQSSGDVTASVALPPGVSYLAGGSLGMDALTAGPAPGGWSCEPAPQGVTCTHAPLAADQSTRSYLVVLASLEAKVGVPPTITVSSAGQSTTSASSSGVVTSGLPAEFAASGRLDTIVTGNSLSPCWRWDDGWHPPSSSATVSVPGDVLWAGLYWSGVGYQPQSAIDLRGPAGGYQRIAAGSVASTDEFGLPAYQDYANVTSLVAASGGGTWQAQAPADETNPVADAGWTLVVVAQDPAAPVGQAIVLDGAHAVTPFDPSFDVPLNSLFTAGTQAAVQSVTWNDWGMAGDPDLASRRETLSGAPDVELTGGNPPYLVGVVAVTTSHMSPLASGAPLRHCLPSSLVRSSLAARPSVQAAPRPVGSRGRGHLGAHGLAQPSPGVAHRVGQRAVAQAGQSGALAGGFPPRAQPGGVGGQRPVTGRPGQFGRLAAARPRHAQAGAQQLTQRVAGRPGHVDRAGDAAADAVHHPGRQVAGVD
jgi:RNA polymerase sigma factor (sigma-70 family)